MRRLVSISAMMAMLVSLFSPLLAQAQGADASHPMACHRAGHTAAATKHHHCAEMTAAARSASSPDGRSIKTGRDLPQCPMDCCMQGHPQNGTALNSIPQVPAPAVAETHRQFIPVTFTGTGFSSHTDRGPPAI